MKVIKSFVYIILLSFGYIYAANNLDNTKVVAALGMPHPRAYLSPTEKKFLNMLDYVNNRRSVAFAVNATFWSSAALFSKEMIARMFFEQYASNNLGLMILAGLSPLLTWTLLYGLYGRLSQFPYAENVAYTNELGEQEINVQQVDEIKKRFSKTPLWRRFLGWW